MTLDEIIEVLIATRDGKQIEINDGYSDWRDCDMDGMSSSPIPFDFHSCEYRVKKFDPETLDHGLYRIFWNDGSTSLASVGSDAYGNRWFAPTNWISGNTYDWSDVDRVELIEGD